MERRSLNCLKWGIFFTFVNIEIGQLNLLPEFVGMLLFYASIRSHQEPRPGESRVAPLFLVLAADYFLHWIWQFENAVEGLLALAVSLYVTGLEFLRACAVILQCIGFLVSPFGFQALNLLLTIAVIGVCIALIVAVCGIRQGEAVQG